MSLTTQLLAYLGSRLRFLLLLLVLLGVYAVVGRVLIPHLAQTNWLPELARQHQIAIEAKDMSFDPFGFGVQLRGVTVNDAKGQPFLSANEASVDLKLASSLRHFHPTLSVELDAPAIRLDRDKKGQWNLAGLWPPRVQSESKGLPVALTHLTLNHGQVEFRDARRGKPVTTRFTDVDLELRDFTGDASKPSTYRMAGKGPGQESFASEGTLLLEPMTVDGSLAVEQLYLPFWLDALPTALPWRIATGQLTTQLRFHMPAANDVGVALEVDHLLLTGLNAMDRQNPAQWIRAARIELDKTRLGTEAPPLSLGSLQISDIESPWGKFGALKTGRITTDLSGPNIRLEGVAVENLQLKEGKAPSLMTGTLVYDAKSRQLQLANLRAPDIESRWGAVSGLALEGLSYQMTENQQLSALKLDGLSLETAKLPVGQAKSLKTGPLTYDAGKAQLSISSLMAAELHSKWGDLGGLALVGLDYEMNEQQQPRKVSLSALSLETIDLTQGKAKWLQAGPLTYDAEKGRLNLSSLSAAEAQSEWGGIGGLTMDGLEFSQRDGELKLRALSANQVDSRWAQMTSPTLSGLDFSSNKQRLSFDHFAAGQINSDWGNFTSPDLQNVEYDIATRSLQAASLNSGAIETPQGKLGSLSAEDLRFKGKDQQIKLASGRFTDLQSELLNVGQMVVEDLDYQHSGKRFQVKSAELTDAVAQGFIENEAVAIPTLPANPPSPTDPSAKPAVGQQDNAAQTYPRRARLGTLRLENAKGDLEHRFLAAHLISSGKTEMDIIRRKNGSLEIRGLPPVSGGSGSPKSESPLLLGIEAVQLEDYSINFYDEKMEPPARFRFNGLTLKADDLTTDRDNAMEFRVRTQIGSSARFEAEGRLQLKPLLLSFRFGLDKLRMRTIEPYWKPLTNIDLQRGNLSLWGDVIAREAPDLTIDYAGGAEVLEFDSIDRVTRLPVLKWDLIKVDGLAISNKPQRFVARVITAENAFARVALDEHRHLNLLAALEPPSQAAIPSELEALQVEKTPANKLPSAAVGLLRIKNGTVDFSDRSMKPGFSGEITHFDGTVSGLTSRAGARATLSLSGKFNGNAPVNVFGELDPTDYRDHTNVTAQFKGINLTTFSAYSGKFGGYRIEKGKLDMTFNYQMRDGLMEMTNQAVLDKLTLGDRVDDNTSWLVDFALYILKNGDGKIDIDLPIYGDLTNPQFNLWTLYRDAFTSLIAKLFYTPASLVNEVINGEETQHFTLSFPAGEAEMVESSVNALKTIADSLQSTLGSTLDILGTADPRQDRLSLAGKALLEELKNARRVELRAQGVRLRGAPVPDLTDEDYRRLFTAYYREKFPASPEIRTIDKENQKLLSGRLFENARNKVLDTWPIDETHLRALAQSRAESIRGFLIEEQGISDERLFLRDVKIEVSPDQWIRSELTLESF